MEKAKGIIRAALLQNQTNERVEDIQITKEALEKAHMYAKKIQEVHGSNLECYFFLISPVTEKDRIVRDIYFPEQEVTHASVRISEDTIIKSGKILREKGFRILGWAHSHASFHTFHSGTDDANHVSVLNEISSDNYVEIANEKEMFRQPVETSIGKDKIIITDKSKRVSLILDVSGDFRGKVISSKLSGPIRVGFAYSLVVNADEKLRPHCEIAIKEFCPLYLREKEVETYKVPISIIQNQAYKAKIDIDEIMMQIKDNVREVSLFDFRRREESEVSINESDYVQDGSVYTKEEVNLLLKQQKEELEEKSRSLVSKIMDRVWYILFGSDRVPRNHDKDYAEIKQYAKEISKPVPQRKTKKFGEKESDRK